MHPLSLCHYTLFRVPPPEFVDIAASVGFHHVSLMLQFPRGDDRGFPMLGDTPMRRATRERLTTNGISLFDVSTCRLDPEVNVQAYRPMFESAACLGAAKVSVSIFDVDEQRRVDRFAEACQVLSEYRLGAGLEFMPLSSVKTLADAVKLIRRAGAANAAITIDATHLHRSGGTATDVAHLDAELISYAQLCDGPASLPREKWGWEAGQERRLPGAGDFELRALINALPTNMLIGVEAPTERLGNNQVTPHHYARMAFDALRRTLSDQKPR